MLLVGAVRRGRVRHPARRPDPAAARRLPRDRHARVRRDRARRVPQLRQVHERHERHHRHRAAQPVRPVRHPRLRVHEPLALLPHRDGDHHGRRDPAVPATGFAPRRAWVAIREDELAAASMGINTVTTKLLAFAIGASTAGLAGVFYASKLAIVSPGPVRVLGLVHRAGDGRPRRHGQHLGRRGRRVHHLRAPEPGPQAARQRSSRASTSRSSRSDR